MAKYWNPATIDYPMEFKIKYTKELISRYGAVGAFNVDNPAQPLAWTFRKTGTQLYLYHIA